MLATDKQSQDLNKIAGVEDLSHENAAAVSGGTMELAGGLDRTGEVRRYERGSFKDLRGFNNKASSFNIAPGAVWRFWTGKNFTGQSFTSQGADKLQGFTNLTQGLKSFNNDIESIQRIE